MTSKGTVNIAAIWEMLSCCADGYTVVETDHHYRVCYGGRTFPTLRKGPHGNRRNVQIQIGHVRKMVRQLNIEDCARRLIKAL